MQPRSPGSTPGLRFIYRMRSSLTQKFRQLNLSAATLHLLLERTPVLRLVSPVAETGTVTRIAALLRTASATVASLGAVHALAGATQFIVSANNVYGSLGTPITPVVFTVTGATIPPGSFRITGPLPPGVTAPNLNASGVLNGATGVISGTPTAIGTYTLSLLAYERPDAMGDTYGPTLISFVITATPSAAPSH